ncbi:MAG: SMP-30/gluconolactonase/LRE family protein [Acidimicrobiales bacterium]|nr:SMP-30/gluconolactonase/LRE family protein [Acidimicrobiales bacterium]
MRVMTTGLRFPEGPIALPNGDVLLVEIARGTLTRCRPDGSTDVVAETGGGPNGAALGPDGKVYICNNGGFEWHERGGLLLPGFQPASYVGGSIQRVDVETGAVETLYTHCGDRQLRGPNDIVFDRHGGFYFTDLGKGRDHDMDRGAIYYASTDGSSITQVAAPLLTPNGIGLSPEEDRLYYAETATGRVWYWELDAPGVLRITGPQVSSTSVAATLLANVGGIARLDSLAVDSEGNVCVATLMVGSITAIAPDGSIRAVVPVPGGDFMVTNICFGGPDLTTAYITASGKGTLYAHEWHCPGLKLNFGGWS